MSPTCNTPLLRPSFCTAGFAGEFSDGDLARLERCLPSSIFYKEPDAQARVVGVSLGWG